MPAAASTQPGELRAPGPPKRALDTTMKESQPQKRSRVSRACDQCRASREKCDGAQPSCQTCSLQKRQCSYNDMPKKRGIQPNYIRTLELTLAWLFQTFADTESHLATMLQDPDAQVPQLITGRDSSRTESMHQAWRNGIICKQIDQTLSGTPVEAFEPSARHLSAATATDTIDGESHQHRSFLLTNTSKNDTRESGSSRRVASAESAAQIKLPQDVWMLLEYYFAFTHSWLPITEKSSILKLVYSYPPEGIAQDTASTAAHAELWSIMALSASQLSGSGRRNDGASICKTARSILPSEYSAMGLGHVKALLLFGLIEVTDRHWLPAWLLVGSAVRVLFCNRASGVLDKFGADERFDHVCLAAFILESAIAVELSAPTHIRTEHIAAIGFVNEEGLEEWSPWHNPLDPDASSFAKAPSRSCSTFNNVLRLTICRLENSRKSGNADRDQFSGGDSSNGGRFGAANGNLDPALATGNIVLSLAQNASQPATQVQPNAVLAQRMGVLSGSIPPSSQPNLPQLQQHLPLSMSARSPGSPYGADNGEPSTRRPPPMSFWPTDDASGAGADIFEELAMLERSDANQPQFMQNLGFAADLDLAEFFGADYMPNPMLAYVQQPQPSQQQTDAG